MRFIHQPRFRESFSLSPARRTVGIYALAMFLVLGAGTAWAESPWPTVALPNDVSAYKIGEQIVVNGLPMRMQGFESSAGRAELAVWFRKSMGQPLVENTLGNKLILGRAQGEHYVTVQLESTATGTRGLVGVTQVKTAFDNRTETRAASERLLSRLPSGSRLVSRMTSDDGGKLATHVVIANTYGEEVNRDRVVSMMKEDGLNLEREGRPEAKTMQALSAAAAGARTLFFKGQGKEAVAVIRRDDTGHTNIVLNTTTFMERYK